MAYPKRLKPSLDWLLVFVAVAVGLEYLSPAGGRPHTWIFLSSCLAIIPLAGWMGKATEQLAARAGEGIGGFINATFGNAAELIIGLMALRAGLYDVVKASLTGSIIGNVLLVLGMAFVAGGVRHKSQRFNVTGARMQATLLTLAAISLIIPAMFNLLAGPAGGERIRNLSQEMAVVLLAVYGMSLLFSLRTHKHLFSGQGAGEGGRVEEGHSRWPLWTSLAVLLVTTAAVAFISEILVGSVGHAAETMGMTKVFVGVVVVAIIGNAAEHSTAVIAAWHNRMELCFGIAIGSSIQVALFIAPLLVLLSNVVGPGPMDLVFTPAEVLAVALSVVISNQISNDGESNWMEGVQLLAVYLMIAIVFYFLPAAITG